MTKQFRAEEAISYAFADPAARHIAIVVHTLGSGGAQRRLVTLANAFAAAGRKVDFVAIRREGDVGSLLRPEVHVTVLNESDRPFWLRRLFDGRRELSEWVDAHRPDVLLGGITTVHLSASIACRQIEGERPLLVLRVSCHPDRFFPWTRPIKRALEPPQRWIHRRLYDRADLVVAVSEETANAVRSRIGEPERCVTLPNPVITDSFLRSLDDPPPHPWLSADVPVIVGVGRMAWQKRFDILLEAVAMVRRRRAVRLIILGTGKGRTLLERQAERLGIRDSVDFPGAVDRVGAWLAHSNLLVSTSAFEGSPAVLIEALAAGIPVVATRCPGGSAELLSDGVGGLLVPMDDPSATARAILRMIGRPFDRAFLRRRVARYGEIQSARRYVRALDSALLRHRGLREGDSSRSVDCDRPAHPELLVEEVAAVDSVVAGGGDERHSAAFTRR